MTLFITRGVGRERITSPGRDASHLLSPLSRSVSGLLRGVGREPLSREAGLDVHVRDIGELVPGDLATGPGLMAEPHREPAEAIHLVLVEGNEKAVSAVEGAVALFLGHASPLDHLLHDLRRIPEVVDLGRETARYEHVFEELANDAPTRDVRDGMESEAGLCDRARPSVRFREETAVERGRRSDPLDCFFRRRVVPPPLTELHTQSGAC